MSCGTMEKKCVERGRVVKNVSQRLREVGVIVKETVVEEGNECLLIFQIVSTWWINAVERERVDKSIDVMKKIYFYVLQLKQ